MHYSMHRIFFLSEDLEAAGTRSDAAPLVGITSCGLIQGFDWLSISFPFLDASKTIDQSESPMEAHTTGPSSAERVYGFSCWSFMSYCGPAAHFSSLSSLSLSLSVSLLHSLTVLLWQRLSLFYQQTFVCVLSLTIHKLHTL